MLKLKRAEAVKITFEIELFPPKKVIAFFVFLDIHEKDMLIIN
jgi:hypothetical protein